MKIEGSQTYTPQEVAGHFSVKRKTVYDWINKYDLNTVRVNKLSKCLTGETLLLLESLLARDRSGDPVPVTTSRFRVFTKQLPMSQAGRWLNSILAQGWEPIGPATCSIITSEISEPPSVFAMITCQKTNGATSDPKE